MEGLLSPLHLFLRFGFISAAAAIRRLTNQRLLRSVSAMAHGCEALSLALANVPHYWGRSVILVLKIEVSNTSEKDNFHFSLSDSRSCQISYRKEDK